MEREEFVRELEMLLDLLAKSNNKDFRICGSGNTDTDLNFTVWNGELYSFDLQLCIGDEVILYMKGVHKQGVIDMFTDTSAGKISELNISVSD